MASIVQQTATAQLVNGNTSAKSFGSLPAVGNAIFVTIAHWHATTSTISTVTDNQGNSYSLVKAQIDAEASSSSGEVWMCNNVTTSSGTFTITVTPTSGTGNYLTWRAIEVSGLSNPAGDKTVSTGFAASGTTTSSGNTAATTQADELILAFMAVTSSDTTMNITTPTGYTELWVENDGQTAVGAECAYKIVAATGVQSASWTHDVDNGSSGIVCTFKIAAAAMTSPGWGGSDGWF